MKYIVILISAVMLSGCFADNNAQVSSVQLGKTTFEENCSVCHGKQAQGLSKDWKQRQANGMFPAPPLNGTAHAWHHSPKALMHTINHGGVRLGGWMPGFKDSLSQQEKQALLDYIYSLWSKDIQQRYDAKFK
jgi:mono/diheme cytochrome c family protein